jgi:hypothetical protein
VVELLRQTNEGAERFGQGKEDGGMKFESGMGTLIIAT